MTKSKQWLCIFFALFFLGIAGFMGLNYYVDPLDYFTVPKGKESHDTDNYSRAIKTEYVVKNKDKIDALIMAGSKGGVLSTKLLSEYTGKNYYNFTFNRGNFSDYYKYLKFLIDHTDISEVTLHLSSFEVDYFTKENSKNYVYQPPAILSGNKWKQFTEFCSYLMTDIKTTLKTIQSRKHSKVSSSYDITTGERTWSSAINRLDKLGTDYPSRYVVRDLDKNLKSFFNQNAEKYTAFDQNIEAMKEIKQLCDENNVTLKVVIGASFIGERNTYECYRYYEYLRQMVQIVDVWDFSNFHPINMNPYNFINTTHYTAAVGDLMINTMYGKDSRDGFGIYLTKDNINDYLDQRIADYRRLEEEYKTTGTLALPGIDDESYVDTNGGARFSA